MPEPERRLAAIVSADVAGYSRLMADDEAVGTAVPHARFVVYSRGTGGEWPDTDYRRRWAEHLERRFPSLSGRVTTLAVPGGVAEGNFQRPAAGKAIRALVESLLGQAPGRGKVGG